MDAYEISETNGSYAVLAHGRPQLLFASFGAAQAALMQILELDGLPPRPDFPAVTNSPPDDESSRVPTCFRKDDDVHDDARRFDALRSLNGRSTEEGDGR